MIQRYPQNAAKKAVFLGPPDPQRYSAIRLQRTMLGGTGGVSSERPEWYPQMPLLTDTAIRNVKSTEKAVKLFDGSKQYLIVKPSDGGLWHIQYRVNGLEKLISFGQRSQSCGDHRIDQDWPAASAGR